MEHLLNGDMGRYGEREMVDDDFALDIGPLNHPRLRIDLRNLAELPNEAGDRLVPLHLIAEDDALINMLQFEFSLADSATQSGDMPQDFLEEEDIQGICPVKKKRSRREKPQKKRFRTTVSTSAKNCKCAKPSSDFGTPKKNSYRSKTCVCKKLQCCRAQSDVSVRRSDRHE